jgi:hypothetical protein
MLCHAPEQIALDSHDVGVSYIEQPCGAFRNGPQRGFGFGWRVGDSAQHLGRRRLLG